MPDQEIIDALIASYRELNHRVRGANINENVTIDELTAGHSSISGALFNLRNRELNASQAIKQMLLGGDALADDEQIAELSEQQAAAGVTPSVLLSQFGTAREATLSLVRELPDEEWDKTHTTPRGQQTLREYLQSLVDRDRQRINEIDALLPKVSA